jgi:hypothetical protein
MYRALKVWNNPCINCWPAENDWDKFVRSNAVAQSQILSFPPNESPKCPQCGTELIEEGSIKQNPSGVWYWDGHHVWGCPSCNKWGIKIGEKNDI